MKKLIYLLAMFSLFSCEKYDLLEDIADIKETRPNVYLAPISPTANPGSEVNLSVQFWSTDDVFNYIGLYHTVDTSTLIQIEVYPANISFTYEKALSGKKLEETEYREIPYSFDDWSPDKNAYAVDVKYPVDIAYKKISVINNAGSTNKPQFIASLYPEAENEFYTELAKKLNKTKMKTLIVDSVAYIGVEEFESKYDAEGKYLEGSENYFADKLAEIGMLRLIHKKYLFQKIHSVSLRFKIRNGSDTEGISAYRSFNVQ
jgi:hypothetical protein